MEVSKFRFWDLFKSKVTYYLLILLCAFPLMVFHIQSKVIIFWALLSLIFMVKKSGKKFFRENLVLYFINIGWVIWLLVTLIYSSDVLVGLKEFERIISIIIVPLIIFFFTDRISSRKKFILFLTFAIAILCFTIYSYVYIINYFKVHYYSLYLKGNEFDLFHYIKFHLKVSRLYLYGSDSDSSFLLFYHKSYYSLSLLFCICFLVYSTFKKPKYKFYFIPLLLVFVLMMFVHLSKVHVLLLVFFCVISLLFYLSKIDLSTIKHKNIIIIVSMITAAFGYYGANKNADYLGSSFISRNNINECSVALIKESPILGYGFGSVKRIMKDCYTEKLKTNPNFKFPLQLNQNTHNYYFYIYLSGGILGLILFLIMAYYNINIALQNNDKLYLLFLIGIFITLLFENSLFRIYGILYFTIFNSIFLQKYLRTN